MDSDFFIFSPDSGSRYLYDSNTNTIHPLPDFIESEFIRQVYDSPVGESIVSKFKKEKYPVWLLRYFDIWRGSTKAFQRVAKREKTYIQSVEKIQREQFVSSLACDLILVASEQCNLRCAYCVFEKDLYDNRRSHQTNHMDRKTTFAAIDLYFALNAREALTPFSRRALNIVFYGGEALLNWETVRAGIEYARTQYTGSSELHVGLSTNLTLFDEDWIPFLRQHNVFLNISLDGPREEHDRYRRFADGSPTFDVIHSKLRAIHDRDRAYYKKYVKALVTINGNTSYMNVVDFFENDPYAPPVQTVSMLKDFEDSEFHRKYPYDKDRYRQSAEALTCYYDARCQEGPPLFKGEILHALNHEAFGDFFNAAHMLSDNRSWHTGCCLPNRKITVVPDGNIYICERVGTNNSIGNVWEGIDEQKQIAYFNAFFNSTQDCPSCWARHRCRICPAEVDSGKDGSCFEDRCEGARKTVASNLSALFSRLERKADLFTDTFEFY